MENLELLAKQKGYERIILETGRPLVAAYKLYESMGYKVIANYGQYSNMPSSICMEKK